MRHLELTEDDLLSSVQRISIKQANPTKQWNKRYDNGEEITNF